MPTACLRRRIAGALRGALFGLATLAPVAAADTLAPVSIEPRSFASVADWTQRSLRPCCTVERIAVEGMVLLEIRARLDVPWTDALQRLSIQAKDISVTLPDGTALGAIGEFQYEGQFMLRPPGLTATRPRDWPATDADAWVAPAFLVPAGTPSVVFRVADQLAVEVAVPAPGIAPSAAEFAEFRLLRAVRTDRLSLTQTIAGQTVTSEITPAPGYGFLELEIGVNGRAANSFGQHDRFQWHTHTFHLVDDRGDSMGLIGERFMNRVLGWQFSGVKPGETATRSVIWTVPTGLDEATLLFGDTPVLALAGGAAPAPDAAAPDPAAPDPAAPDPAAATPAAPAPAPAAAAPVPAAAAAAADLAAAVRALAVGLGVTAGPAPKPCAPGAVLEAEWNGTWWKAVFREGPDAAGRCRISYDGFDASWDEWVGAERMRAR